MAVINAANAILSNFAQQGFDLTLRQLYYQFVATQPLEEPFLNKEQSYKRLGSIINDARLAGLIDWARIIDRTRNVTIPNAWTTPADIIESAAVSYQIDLWKDQRYYVEAWVEKDALIGVLEKPCKAWRLPSFSCRGYTSQSEVHGASKRLLSAVHRGKIPVILHMGDHDPSGVDMSRDITDRLSMFCRQDVDLRRLALTIEQVQEQEPPPNPAKLTDSRCAGYIEKFGDESWELDALSPTYIADLIDAEVLKLVDLGKFNARKVQEAEEKKLLQKCSDQWDDVVEFLNPEEE
jgi:hypothetical protein